MDATVLVNGTRAAESGQLHGQYLGELIEALSDQKIEKVHFIAHSAGSWIARGATRHILKQRIAAATPIKTQITLLDPFIPGEVVAIDSSLSKTAMNGINFSPGATSDSLFRLENYFASDETPGTNSTFSWRSGVDEGGLLVGGPEFGFDIFDVYRGHGGPIQYYADTVAASSSPTASDDVFLRLAAADLENENALNTWGWRRSIFYNEPIATPRNPTVTEVAGGGKTLTGNARRRGAAAAATGIQYHWEVSTTSATSGFSHFRDTGSLPVLTLTAAEVNIARRWFRLLAKTDAGIDNSDAREVVPNVPAGGTPTPTPATAPANPSSLVAKAVSPSQINLSWIAGSSNHTGFKVERRTDGGSWSQIATSGIPSFSNVGLTPGTKYFYQVRAYNSAGNSPGYSTEHFATTYPPAGTTYTLQVDAVDLAASQTLAVSVGSWTGGGDNYQTRTTGFTRTVVDGTRLSVTAPATLASGKIFQYWLLDAVTRTYNTVASVEMDGTHNFIAIYGTSAPPVRTPTSLAIEGDSSVDENDSETYKARATYSDGTSALVSGVDWDITSGSSYADISSSGRLDAEAVSSDRSITIEATYTIGGVTRTATKNVTIRNAVSTQTFTLTRNVVGEGRIGYSPQATSYAAGTIVTLHGNEDDGNVFSHWSGDITSTDGDEATVRMDRNRTVTAHFAVDTSEGNINVLISPPQAVAEGAKWKYDNFTAWRDSGDDLTGISPRAGKYVTFNRIDGWIEPEPVKAVIIGGQTTLVPAAAATYREILGAVQVTISPPQAAQAGARWKLNGGEWQESSVSLPNVSTGNHTIEFLAIPGWATPPSQNISVARGITTTRTGEYGPPAGFPIITSVSPKTGPIEGGTTVTIEGANFQPGATITFGGVPATSVTVVSGSKITANTPARASYGTVTLALTSSGQTVSQANGFSYLNALGQNIELVGQIGGSYFCVAAQGSLAYIGEGTSFVVLDVSNPASPVERGRIALPTFVKDIAISNGKAFVATGVGGLFVLDVTSPTSPTVLGFFDTTGESFGIAVDGSTAYVADGAAGLQILDVSNPAAPTLISSLDTPGDGLKVSISTIAAKKWAFIADGDGGIRVADVTNPISPVETTSIPATGLVGFSDLKVVNGLLYAGAFGSEDSGIYDISNPATPLLRGAFGTPAPALDVAGTNVYIYDGVLRVFNAANPSSLAEISVTSLGTATEQIRVSGGLAFIACGREGFRIISVSNPASPVIRSTITGIGRVNEVTVSGGIALVGRDVSGMATVDISNPAHPVGIGSIGSQRVTGIAVQG